MAPKPLSPHINVFSTVFKTIMLSFCSFLKCFDVIGCSYINVFIAGHTTTGYFKRLYVYSNIFSWLNCYWTSVKSHALITQVKRLSHIPLTIFAIVLADRGAIKIISAHFLSSICRTGSPLFYQVLHSFSSVNTSISLGISVMKC